ncbi:hypothetical protein HHK36_002393 [Tetracentron sinense]|uniref:RRM domain-containing protein n=1 Tax=Tetracentron sinense TaxID=13715 RepID=A0A834ZQ82_TETSI|nr:hypothetical protein HHK36_002393 [Tetracentron sinense]
MIIPKRALDNCGCGGAGAGAGLFCCNFMAYQRIPGSNSGSQFRNSHFGDTTYTKVFVGGLAWETQSETLRRYFEQFGVTIEAVVITDKYTGRSKGYGFVTFSDPVSAKRACADPNPVIDFRRVNCNLASFGRPQSSLSYGRLRSATPYIGSVQAPLGSYSRSPSYHQSVSSSYQQGFTPPYGNTTYGPEFAYPQGIYSPYVVGQQYLQIYGVPGTVNRAIYSYGQLGQTLPGSHGYRSVRGYAMSDHHIMQFSGPSVTGLTTTPIPTIQAPYPTSKNSIQSIAPVPAQAQFKGPAHSPQFRHGSGSDQRQGGIVRLQQETNSNVT